MAREKGPKRIAAEEQAALMRSQGHAPMAIREALKASGLTWQQVRDVVPMDTSDMEPAAMIVVPPDAEDKAAVIDGAVHFLEGIAKRITPDMANRFSDLTYLKKDALTWARKVKNANN